MGINEAGAILKFTKIQPIEDSILMFNFYRKYFTDLFKPQLWGWKQLFVFLFAGIIFLCCAHTINDLIGRPFWPITKIIYLGWPTNLPTWYTSIILFCGASGALSCYISSKRRKLKPSYGWFHMTILMLLLSLDEVAELHEQSDSFLPVFFPKIMEKCSHTAWPVALAPVIICILIYITFILYKHLRGSRKASILIISGFAIMIGSGVFLEMTINFLNHQELQGLWDVEVVMEETGEMIGAALIGLGFFVHNEHLLRV